MIDEKNNNKTLHHHKFSRIPTPEVDKVMKRSRMKLHAESDLGDISRVLIKPKASAGNTTSVLRTCYPNLKFEWLQYIAIVKSLALSTYADVDDTSLFS